MKTYKFKHVAASFLVGALFFSSVGYAATASNIEAYFQPLKYFFDGVEKKAPDDQQGFIYNGTTYVPLRFVAESLGQKVGYDAPTFGVYVGKQKEGQVTYMEEMKTITADLGDAVKETAFVSNTGEKFIHGYSITTYVPGWVKNEYVLNGSYKKFEAFLAPSESWSKNPVEKDIGNLKVYADGKLVYSSGGISSDITKPVKVDVDLTGVLKVSIEFVCKPTPRSNTRLGLLDAKFIN